MRICVILMLLSALFTTGCLPASVGADEVTGYFVRQYPQGTDELWICETGTWRRTYTQTGGRPVLNSGGWEFVESDEARIVLEGFPDDWMSEGMRARKPEAPPSPHVGRGYTSMLVVRRGDTVRLILDVDLGTHYSKQPEAGSAECV